VRGIQVALGFLLLFKGIQFIANAEIFIGDGTVPIMGLPLNIIVGLVGLIIAIFLLTNRKFPAAIVLITFGLLVGLALKTPDLSLGPQILSPQMLTVADISTAFVLLVLPQIPVTLSNAVVSTSDLSKKYFKKRGSRASPKALSSSIGIANLAAGALGGMPMCHGAGGLAAHHRFGARTGGANLMIGGIFIAMALIFGSSAVSILGLIPLSILGVLLVFTGIQMVKLATDMRVKSDLIVVSTVVGLALVASMTIAFMIGIILYYLLKRWGLWLNR